MRQRKNEEEEEQSEAQKMMKNYIIVVFIKINWIVCVHTWIMVALKLSLRRAVFFSLGIIWTWYPQIWMNKKAMNDAMTHQVTKNKPILMMKKVLWKKRLIRW